VSRPSPSVCSALALTNAIADPSKPAFNSPLTVDEEGARVLIHVAVCSVGVFVVSESNFTQYCLRFGLTLNYSPCGRGVADAESCGPLVVEAVVIGCSDVNSETGVDFSSATLVAPLYDYECSTFAVSPTAIWSQFEELRWMYYCMRWALVWSLITRLSHSYRTIPL